MIINPRGDIIAEGGREPDAIVMAGTTADFRARLFRERVPEAYQMLTEARPPILDKLKHIQVASPEDASRLMAEGLTTGADAFYEADGWLAEGRIEDAKERFVALAGHFGTLWIGRASRERLQSIADAK
jgi:hypothetical protein